MTESQPTRLRILWIARTCPYPANDGEKLRVFNLLKHLSSAHDLAVIFRVATDEEEEGTAELSKYCRAGVFGVRIPRPRGTADRLRWLLPFVFSRYPLALCTVYFAPIARRLQHLVSDQRFDIVQVEHSSLSIYMDKVRFAGQPATVLTMHNIDYVRNERVLRHSPWGIAKLFQWLNQRRFKSWELSALKQYDRVIAMSTVDGRRLEADVPGLVVSVVPNGVDSQAIPYLPIDHDSRSVVFVASMDSEANHDGAMYLVREVWPLLKIRCPNAVLKLVGRAPRAELRAAANGRDVIVTGRVDDVLPFYRESAVAVVPLRSGGGTRLKILEAMAAGIPVVSTTIGCEGLDIAHGRNILIADHPTTFAEAIQRLLDDAPGRVRLAQAGRELVEAQYDWSLIAQHHHRVYEEALAKRELRRV